MIVWIPERIYSLVKNDSKYIEINQKIENYAENSFNSYLSYMYKTTFQDSEGQKLAKEYGEIIYSLIPNDVLKREYQIINTTTEQELLSILQGEDDVENILMIYYQLISFPYSDCFGNDKYFEYAKKFVELIESNVKMRFSERIYIVYYQYKMQLYQQELEKKVETVKFLELYSAFVQFSEYLEKYILNSLGVNYQYSYDILMHKKMEELIKFQEFILRNRSKQVPQNMTLFLYKLEKDINSMQFKYKSFNFFLFSMLHNMFKYQLDCRDFEKAESYLDQIITLLNSAFQNIPSSIQALTHHNFVLTANFFNLVPFYVILIREYLPASKLFVYFPNIPEGQLLTGMVDVNSVPTFLTSNNVLVPSSFVKSYQTELKTHRNYFIYSVETLKAYETYLKGRS
jgi:hypothetical protein